MSRSDNEEGDYFWYLLNRAIREKYTAKDASMDRLHITACLAKRGTTAIRKHRKVENEKGGRCADM